MRRHKGKTGPHGGAAMSFEEIAQELGTTRGGAWMLYKTGMKKLRHPLNRRKVERLRELAAMKGRLP